jgi:hypothetical protein
MLRDRLVALDKHDQPEQDDGEHTDNDERGRKPIEPRSRLSQGSY